MGQLILQGLLHSPVGRLIAIDIAADRLQLARDQGAQETINAAECDRDELAASLKAQHIDVVVDASGSQAGLDLSTDIVRSGGRINLFGWIKGQEARFDPTKWHLGGFTIVNSSPGSRIRNTFPVAIDLIAAGVFDLRPLVSHTTSLDARRRRHLFERRCETGLTRNCPHRPRLQQLSTVGMRPPRQAGSASKLACRQRA